MKINLSKICTLFSAFSLYKMFVAYKMFSASTKIICFRPPCTWLFVAAVIWWWETTWTIISTALETCFAMTINITIPFILSTFFSLFVTTWKILWCWSSAIFTLKKEKSRQHKIPSYSQQGCFNLDALFSGLYLPFAQFLGPRVQVLHVPIESGAFADWDQHIFTSEL